MMLIAVYIVFVLIGDLGAYLIGRPWNNFCLNRSV